MMAPPMAPILPAESPFELSPLVFVDGYGCVLLMDQDFSPRILSAVAVPMRTAPSTCW